MGKISLEELKARSIDCGCYPRLVEIARAAKSPTAAFDLAKREHFADYYAASCRYLAMIKRDYGLVAFKAVSDDAVRRMRQSVTLSSLRPFMQVAQALHYVYMVLSHHDVKSGFRHDHFVPSDYECVYANVVEECLRRYDSLPSEWQEAIGEIYNAKVYLREARRFARDIREGFPVDDYCVQKTALVLSAFVYGVGLKAGIPEASLECGEFLYHFFYLPSKDKEKGEVLSAEG